MAPNIVQALKDQADKVFFSSRAFYNDQLGIWYEKICKLANKEMALPMNTGAEAVETAIKTARRWGYDVKGIAENQAEIIACVGNFHGRTMAAVSLSSDPDYKRGFGPMLGGIKLVPYGDLEALKAAITPNTAAFLVEPIQGESGILIPPEGFLEQAYELCKENNVLFIADEIQAGLGRTGKLFATEWEGFEPDIYILGKALGGGVFPISCVLANRDILGVFNPGSHGSTFGGNPLACAVSIASIDVLLEEKLAERSRELGEYFLAELKKIQNPIIKEVRGRGLFIGLELHQPARPFCEKLKEKGLLCKETHDTVIRFAPPLVIEKFNLDWALEKIREVLA
ncbi:ornithine--oxo-acid transaminase [Mannheimia haemolytica]|uniref:ornithine--oxo-acid transaminase n=1 Tax=Mannheimia haemolytica TaxID=75985 RepID=UPI002B20C5F4|nr:ornithine--oxo-acid transaminase [Mannheimia haemolytica]